MRFRIAPTETIVKIKKMTEAEASRDDIIAELRDRHRRSTRVFLLPGDLVDASRASLPGGTPPLFDPVFAAVFASQAKKRDALEASLPSLALVHEIDDSDNTVSLSFFDQDGDCCKAWFSAEGIVLLERVDPKNHQSPAVVKAAHDLGYTADEYLRQQASDEAQGAGPKSESSSVFDRLFGRSPD